MNRAVYLSGFAHRSASGSTLATAAAAIVAGQVRCGQRNVAGQNWPYYRLGLPEVDWYGRAEQVVRALGRELRADLAIADADWATAGFFFASSSFQIGAVEQAARRGDFARPQAADFAKDVAQWLGIESGPWCFDTACTSSLSALDAAATLIRSGVLRHALLLGTELANDTSLAGFAALQLLSPHACRPLDCRRDGLVLGEAVAAIWMGDERTAGAWGAWRLAGLDAALDSHSPTGPNPDGKVIAAAMAKAIERAGLRAQSIDVVKLQAGGSPAVDMAEVTALRLVFGDCMPPLVSLKPYFGHTLGASGAVELSALVACLARNAVPATPGYAASDAAIGLVSTTAILPMETRYVLFNAIGFGGSVVCMVLERTA